MARKLSQQLKEEVEVREKNNNIDAVEEIIAMISQNSELKNKILARLKGDPAEKTRKERVRERIAKYLPQKQLICEIENQLISCKPILFQKTHSIGYNGVGKIELNGERYQVVINVVKIGHKLTEEEVQEIMNV